MHGLKAVVITSTERFEREGKKVVDTSTEQFKREEKNIGEYKYSPFLLLFCKCGVKTCGVFNYSVLRRLFKVSRTAECLDVLFFSLFPIKFLTTIQFRGIETKLSGSVG